MYLSLTKRNNGSLEMKIKNKEWELELPFFILRLSPESYELLHAAGLLACSVLIMAFPSQVLGTVASGVIKT